MSIAYIRHVLNSNGAWKPSNAGFSASFRSAAAFPTSEIIGDSCPLPTLTAMDSSPQPIGSGSFGSVYMILSSLVAFKEVQLESNAAQLHAEFEALEQIYKTCQSSDALFSLPRPLAYKDAQKFRALAYRSPRTGHPRPLVASASFAAFERPTYAMDRIQALSTEVAARIRSQFYPSGVPAKGPLLFRLYFGKDFTDNRPSRFINTSHFFLDVARYRQLASSEGGTAGDLPSTEIVAEAMGNMLGRIHICGGYDARDIEFVLGGNGFSGFAFYVIDFNQMRKWKSVNELVDAHIANDPYFPVARRGEQVYEAFRSGYRAAYATRLDIADEFLSQLEALQDTDGRQAPP
ncbi:uncharacterized protein EV420DRAFT_627649 [Desarmillaria tabescens]|uniref:DUF3669 domain-containing protein n=1 Tax=Armillaria tabescens TaxID=1929756 RepID=A0AA39K1I3_ARMTA|nr:uncharacterized protein EV420DRAFT_627649 [Desarmillaria tabescens]KAK0452871.1 hypothetical protein EV420DRAFT_627649 [Desarmillaria tabescens]